MKLIVEFEMPIVAKNVTVSDISPEIQKISDFLQTHLYKKFLTKSSFFDTLVINEIKIVGENDDGQFELDLDDHSI
tara:strand:+ start:2512 stop:2739 length:228 start_codon:yes stop_codon:yes gene_type:complete